MLQEVGSREIGVLRWTVAFLIVAMVAGFVGFSNVAGTATEMVRSIFIAAIILFVISGLYGKSEV